jgi:hypothetical protein
MADYRDVTEWNAKPDDDAGKETWRHNAAASLFDDPDIRRRVAELISRAAQKSRKDG